MDTDQFTEKELKRIERVKRRFGITQEFKIEYAEKGKQETVIMPKYGVYTLRLDDESVDHDLFDIWADASVGLERGALISTYVFQRDLNEKESGFAMAFHSLTRPLVDIWSYKRMAEVLTKKEMDAELDEMFDMLCAMSDKPFTKHRLLAGYLILKHFNYSVKVEITANKPFYVTNGGIEFKDEVIGEHKKYIDLIDELSKETPSPELLIKIPTVLNAPYEVKIVDGEYYEIRERENLIQ